MEIFAGIQLRIEIENLSPADEFFMGKLVSDFLKQEFEQNTLIFFNLKKIKVFLEEIMEKEQLSKRNTHIFYITCLM